MGHILAVSMHQLLHIRIFVTAGRGGFTPHRDAVKTLRQIPLPLRRTLCVWEIWRPVAYRPIHTAANRAIALVRTRVGRISRVARFTVVPGGSDGWVGGPVLFGCITAGGLNGAVSPSWVNPVRNLGRDGVVGLTLLIEFGVFWGLGGTVVGWRMKAVGDFVTGRTQECV